MHSKTRQQIMTHRLLTQLPQWMHFFQKTETNKQALILPDPAKEDSPLPLLQVHQSPCIITDQTQIHKRLIINPKN